MILSKPFFTTLYSVYIALFPKSNHKIKQAVAFSSPVSTLYAWNPWDHAPLRPAPFNDHKSLQASSCDVCALTGTWAVWHTAVLQRLCVWWVISLVWVIVMVRISCLMPRVETAFMWTSTACLKRSVALLLDKRTLGSPPQRNWLDENVSRDTRCKCLREVQLDTGLAHGQVVHLKIESSWFPRYPGTSTRILVIEI